MIAAIDIGGTKIAIGLVNGRGTVLACTDIATNPERGHRDAMPRILDVLRVQISATKEVLHGVGIGCTGPIDPVTGEVGDVNTLPGWQGWNPVRELSEAFQVQAAMENDADAAVLGELRWGAGKGKRGVIFITVGTGIGAGIVLNGELYRGAYGSHPSSAITSFSQMVQPVRAALSDVGRVSRQGLRSSNGLLGSIRRTKK
jgi:glucokinase